MSQKKTRVNEQPSGDDFGDFSARKERERRRDWARSPKPIAGVMSNVVNRFGYGREMAGQQLDFVWRQAAGEATSTQTAARQIRRGVLEVLVENSTLIQELTFQKTQLLKQINHIAPELGVRDIRFKSGSLGARRT